MNWRAPVLRAALRFRQPRVLEAFEEARALERAPREQMDRAQQEALDRLLRHAWEHTAHYRRVLEECGAVRDGVVRVDRFNAIPLLDKETLRTEREQLCAFGGLSGRTIYENHSGGSTGQPVSFLQDSFYSQTNIGIKTYHLHVQGKTLGEREMKIWGSERDLFEGTIGLKAKLSFYLYNRCFANCFHLSDSRIRAIMAEWNRVEPRIVWGYVDCLYLMARRALETGERLHRPAVVLCAAGTLHPHMREAIEEAFEAPAVNIYGSREMGDMACECPRREGLHLTPQTHVVEVLNADGQPVMEEDGEIVVTSLHNYAMPLIRYRIGDRGRLTASTCSCGRTYPLLANVSGRIADTFINSRGEYIASEYFIHLIGVVHNTGFIRRFQLVQEEADRLRLLLVLQNGTPPDDVDKDLLQIEEKLRLVMGEHCQIEREFVDDIPPTASGKHRYTISRLAEQPRG
jgi:phenylacetate-CoA ligase